MTGEKRSWVDFDGLSDRQLAILREEANDLLVTKADDLPKGIDDADEVKRETEEVAALGRLVSGLRRGQILMPDPIARELIARAIGETGHLDELKEEYDRELGEHESWVALLAHFDPAPDADAAEAGDEEDRGAEPESPEEDETEAKPAPRWVEFAGRLSDDQLRIVRREVTGMLVGRTDDLPILSKQEDHERQFREIARTTYGYDFLPIWSGRQNPCIAVDDYTYSKTVATAQLQAAEEAEAAIARAERVGFNPGAIIWYDMEQWEGEECLPAFKGFMNTWTKELHAANFKSGLYSSPCSDVLNIVNSSYPPDDVWLAEYSTGAKETPNLRSVYNVNCVGQNAWPLHRFHQWNGSTAEEPDRSYEEWGGVGAVVDEDCAYGPDDGANPDGEAARCFAK
jgi:hypothetical protein